MNIYVVGFSIIVPNTDKSILASVSLTLLVQTKRETLKFVECFWKLSSKKARYDDAEEVEQAD